MRSIPAGAHHGTLATDEVTPAGPMKGIATGLTAQPRDGQSGQSQTATAPSSSTK
jgi:hypothetical protein